MDLSITSIFLLISAVTANCTGQWWSTGRCWDRWREWSQSWRRTLEANGERVKVMMSYWHAAAAVMKEQRSSSVDHLLLSPRRPLWLSPAQVVVIPVGGDSESYSNQVSLELYISSEFACFFYPCRANPRCNQLSTGTVLKSCVLAPSLRWRGSSKRPASWLMWMTIQEQP